MEQQKLVFNRKTTSEILIGTNLLKDTVAKILRMRLAKRCIVLTNETVAKWYLQPLIAELNTRGIEASEIIIPDGEKFKNFETASAVISQLSDKLVERDCPLISLGGGVTGDIGGFVASIFKRGIPHIFLPTTLLSMVDASLGGKTGINTNAGKNLVGTFYQPMLVAIDIAYLQTLPQSQLSYGLVEAIKHGAIADSAYYKFIINNTDAIKSKQANFLQRLVRRSIHIKKTIVLADELDTGSRALLNYGHTFGHAYETIGNYIRLHHGEAVGLGMLTALKIAARLRILEDDYTNSLQNVLEEYNLPTNVPKELDKSEIINTLLQDKKKHNGEYSLVLPVRLGKVIQHKISPAALQDVLSVL